MFFKKNSRIFKDIQALWLRNPIKAATDQLVSLAEKELRVQAVAYNILGHRRVDKVVDRHPAAMRRRTSELAVSWISNRRS